MIDGNTKTAMESLAVVVATQTIAPHLTMDTKVIMIRFSIKITSINLRSLPSLLRIIKPMQIIIFVS
jgi:hypothetical protein